jgi:hypothetical protein
MRELSSRFRIDGGSFGPADPVVIEQFFTNGIHGGEERLMLAVLQDAVECFKNMSWPNTSGKRSCFERLKIGFWRKMPSGFFRLRISVKLYS